MNTMFRSTLAAWFAVLLLLAPSPRANATAIASSSITLSNLTFTPASGTASTSTPDAQAFTNAFNSLGQSLSDGNFGPGADVSANAVIASAEGHAFATASSGTLTAASLVALMGLDGFAGVSSPGSLANLAGLFFLNGVTGMVEVTVSMQVTGSLHGFADAAGMFSTDADASLEIDGTSVLFELFSLSGGPAFSDTTQPFSETLTATLLLDASQPHFYSWNAHTDTTGRSLTAPGDLVMLLTGLGLLACFRAAMRRSARHA